MSEIPSVRVLDAKTLSTGESVYLVQLAHMNTVTDILWMPAEDWRDLVGWDVAGK